MVGFYGRFIDNFSKIVEPFHALKRKNARFVWVETQQAAFERPKEALSMPSVLQIPDFSREFTLVCDASEVAISAVFHHKKGQGLAPVAFSSRLLSPAERKYSIHKKECLAVVYGCEKCRSYLEHNEFSHHTYNQARSWLLRHAKELGRIGRWLLRLTPFMFKVYHLSGRTNVVADCLTRQYEDISTDVTFAGLVLQHLPEAFRSIKDHQKKDAFCRDLYQRVIRSDNIGRNVKLLNGALVYCPCRAKRRRFVLLEALRPTVLEYVHSPTLSAYLGMAKTLSPIQKVIYWPDMKSEVCVTLFGDVRISKGSSPPRILDWGSIVVR
jgi:hypothetical protein